MSEPQTTAFGLFPELEVLVTPSTINLHEAAIISPVVLLETTGDNLNALNCSLRIFVRLPLNISDMAYDKRLLPQINSYHSTEPYPVRNEFIELG